MNSFPRHSLFQGHLITAIPHYHLCSECHSILIYACGDETETLTCAKDDKHIGLVNKDDVVLIPNEDSYDSIRNLDPVLAEFLRQRRQPAVSSLFGDE